MSSKLNSDINNIIRLQLKKPKHWNWELSTSKSSPHIPLPIIQLYDDKKKLLIETKGYERRSWHVSDLKKQTNYETATTKSQDKHHTLNTEDKIKIKEHLLHKSKSDVFSSHRRKLEPSKFTTIKESIDCDRLVKDIKEKCHSFRCKRNKDKSTEQLITEKNKKYLLRSCCAGTLVISEESEKNVRKRRRRSKTSEIKSDSSSSSSTHEGKTTRNRVVRRYTDLSQLSEVVRKKYEKNRSQISDNQDDNKLINNNGTVINNYEKEKHVSCDVSVGNMGANFSRHSSKGLSGRRCQSISNICNSKDHFFDPNGREVDAAYKFCNSLPSPNGTVYNNNYEHKPLTEKRSLQHTLSEHVLDSVSHSNDCHPLQWKFTDTQTCDQGYGSERSPEEEIPPPLPSHDYECDHTLDFCYSSYPFITPENTFEIELVKGSRGLGLSVCGGVDSDGSWPGLLRIKRLFPHQPAAASGLLSVGDLLLEVNGAPLIGLSNYEALEVLRMTPNKVILLVCRPPQEILSTMSPVSDIPPPPPRRASSPQQHHGSCGSTSKMSEDIYETDFEIILTKIHGSLGFTLCKEEENLAGHYVRALVREPAISDGRIRAGDKIIAVNGVEIAQMTHEQAVQFLRQCDNDVLLRLNRDFDRTPVDLSPTEISPNTSFRPKPNLRQEAVDMLTDLAARKLCSSSPCTSPRHLQHYHHHHHQQQPQQLQQQSQHFENIGEDMCDGASASYEHYDDYDDDDDDDDDDKAIRPCFLDLYNPNQTPVAVRKSKFNLSLAHNAYELNNLDPEMLDAPNLNCATDLPDDPSVASGCYPEEPVSMPPLSTSRSANFSHMKPTYQSANHDLLATTSGYKNVVQQIAAQNNHQQQQEHHTVKLRKTQVEHAVNTGFKKVQDELAASSSYKKVKEQQCAVAAPSTGYNKSVQGEIGAAALGIDGHNEDNVVFSAAERDLIENDAQILSIELNRGWNSRLGFSLQEVDGCTCVSAVYPDSVAAKDGRLKTGDCLLRVNDEMVENMKTADVIDLLRIIRGPVCITVLRRKQRLA